jgi:hypothetical protein
MALIFLFTILGFLVGLAGVMIKRKIRPTAALSAVFLGLLAASVHKIVKDYSKHKNKWRNF